MTTWGASVRSLSTETTLNSVYLFRFPWHAGHHVQGLGNWPNLKWCRSGQVKKKNYTNVRSKNTKTLKGIRSVTKQSMHVLFWTINLFHGVYIPVMYSFLNYPHHYMHQVAFGYWWKWPPLRFWSFFFFFRSQFSRVLHVQWITCTVYGTYIPLFSIKFFLKIGLTVRFTHLKIILFQYF